MTQQSAVPMAFQGKGEIKFREINGDLWMTSDDLNKGLGYEDPRAVLNLFVRHQDELKEYSSIIKLMTAVGHRETRVFNEEGIYLISMLAKTPKAKEFRKKVAMLLKELRQHRIAIASKRAISDYRSLLKKIERMGRSNKFIHNLVRYKKMGLTNQEIAKLLSVSMGTVRNYEMIIKKAGLMEVL